MKDLPHISDLYDSQSNLLGWTKGQGKVHWIMQSKVAPLDNEDCQGELKRSYVNERKSGVVFRFAIAFFLDSIIESGVLVFPGNQTILTPFLGTDDTEVLHVGCAELTGEIDVQNSSANTEEHPVLVHGVQIKAGILEIPLSTQGSDAVNVLMGIIGHIQTVAAADLLQNDTVCAAFILIFLLETSEFDFDCFSYLQNDSPFL